MYNFINDYIEPIPLYNGKSVSHLIGFNKEAEKCNILNSLDDKQNAWNLFDSALGFIDQENTRNRVLSVIPNRNKYYF